MIAEGLLWFDDDPRRPLVEKIAHAVERYAERTGWRATVCEAHPAQVEAYRAELARAANAATRRRPAAKPSAKPAAPTVTLPPRLRVAPNSSMQPNCFLIGIEAGETPRRAPAPVSSHLAARRARAKVERKDGPAETPSGAALAAPAAPGAPAGAVRAPRTRTPRAKAS